MCLNSVGEVSLEMEKVFRNMPAGDPSAQDIRAKKVLEINSEHSVYAKIKSLYETDKEAVKEISEILLGQAKLIEGLPIEDMSRFITLVAKHIS